MTREVGPVPPVDGRERRQAQRRDVERRTASAGRALVPVAQAEPVEPAKPADDTAPLDTAAAFAAQLMGPTGQRRGLTGGPPVMDAARTSYLGTEYSGDKDRRPPAGLVKKTDV